MRARTASRLAWSLCVASIAFGATALALVIANGTSLKAMLTDTLPLGAELALAFPIVGALIAARQPSNAVGWIFCVIGVTQGLVELSYQYARYALVTEPGFLPGGGVMSWLNTWTWVPGYGLMITFLLLLFPTGRLPSRRWRPVAWLSALAMALTVLPAAGFWRYRGARLLLDSSELESSLGLVGDLFGIGFPLLLLCGLASTVSLLVRLRRSHGDERQQLKWFTYAAATVAVFAVAVEGILGELVSGWEVIGNLFGILLIPCIPLATGIAILKYRLYDIDRIINRTLVYGVLSAVLAAVYALCVVVIPRALRLGGDSEVVVAGSTLAVAALFQPLRRRIQRLIDRRFYRRRYDAVRSVEQFSSRLRNEVDLEAMRTDLVTAVHETVQPQKVSLWLRA